MLPAQQAGSTAGQATVRVLNAAPDAGFSTQMAGSAITGYTTGAINVTIGTPPAATFSGVGYATASPYQTLAPGSNLTVTASLVGGGQLATGTFTLNGGTSYTLVLAEKTPPSSGPPATPAVYELHLLSE